MTALRVAGPELNLAGRRIDGAGASDGLERRESGARREAPADWLRGEEEDGSEAFGSRRVTGRDLLTGSSFALTNGTAQSGFGSLWHRGTAGAWSAHGARTRSFTSRPCGSMPPTTIAHPGTGSNWS